MNHRITLSGLLRADGRDQVELFDARGVLFAKLYVSPDSGKLRLVLPELENFAQVKIDLDKAKNGFIDFERDPAAARRSIGKAGR